MSQFVEQGHLGGYVPGGDDATYYPDLWTWIVKDFGAEHILDIGCGDGVAVDFFNKIGGFCDGVEGIKQDNPFIYQHDFTTGTWDVELLGKWDLVWCCEFVEHVEEEYVPNILDAFSKAKTVLMTHAEPGQAGFHHVNCQPSHYWVAKLKSIGYNLDSQLTIKTRELAGLNQNPYNHYARSGLAFVRG